MKQSRNILTDKEKEIRRLIYTTNAVEADYKTNEFPPISVKLK